MKDSNELISQVMSNPKSSQQSNESKPLLSGDEMDQLWAMMAGLYGHKWVSSYGEEVDPMGIWRAALKGISFEQIKFGFNKLTMKGAAWPPGAPEFRSMCSIQADDIGLPSEFDAQKAIRSIVMLPRDKPIPEQHPAIYYAYTLIGNFNARQMTTNQLEKAVKDSWGKVEELALSGFEFPEQPLQLESKSGTVHKPVNKDRGNDMLSFEWLSKPIRSDHGRRMGC